MNRVISTSELRSSERAFVTAMQRLVFGRFEFLRIENGELVLATLYIDERRLLVLKAKTTTRENGTNEVELFYGKFLSAGLPDKIDFSFNTQDFKLPKGVTFDYDDGSAKKVSPETGKTQKGKIEITYFDYSVNKGISDSVFK